MKDEGAGSGELINLVKDEEPEVALVDTGQFQLAGEVLRGRQEERVVVEQRRQVLLLTLLVLRERIRVRASLPSEKPNPALLLLLPQHELLVEIVSRPHVHQLGQVPLRELREKLRLELDLQLPLPLLSGTGGGLGVGRLLESALSDPARDDRLDPADVVVFRRDANDVIDHGLVVGSAGVDEGGVGRVEAVDVLGTDPARVARVFLRPLLVDLAERGADALGHRLEGLPVLVKALLEAEAGEREVEDQVLVVGVVTGVRIEDVPDGGRVAQDEGVAGVPLGLAEEVDQEERLDVAQLEEPRHRHQRFQQRQPQAGPRVPGQAAQDRQDSAELPRRVADGRSQREGDRGGQGGTRLLRAFHVLSAAVQENDYKKRLQPQNQQNLDQSHGYKRIQSLLTDQN